MNITLEVKLPNCDLNFSVDLKSRDWWPSKFQNSGWVQMGWILGYQHSGQRCADCKNMTLVQFLLQFSLEKTVVFGLDLGLAKTRQFSVPLSAFTALGFIYSTVKLEKRRQTESFTCLHVPWWSNYSQCMTGYRKSKFSTGSAHPYSRSCILGLEIPRLQSLIYSSRWLTCKSCWVEWFVQSTVQKYVHASATSLRAA